jgi:hypothetical protein
MPAVWAYRFVFDKDEDITDSINNSYVAKKNSATFDSDTEGFSFASD